MFPYRLQVYCTSMGFYDESATQGYFKVRLVPLKPYYSKKNAVEFYSHLSKDQKDLSPGQLLHFSRR